MSLEAVRKVTDAEQDAKVRKTQAVQEAKRLVNEAGRAGQSAVIKARQDAKLQADQLMEQAERNAAAHEAQVIQQTEGQCEALRAQAQGRLEEAAALIVGRVVGA